MSKSKYDEVYAVRSVMAKKGVSVDTLGKVICIGKSAEVGIRVRGKIDYLVNHCGYVVVYTKQTSNAPNIYKSYRKLLSTRRQENAVGNNEDDDTDDNVDETED